MTVCPQCFTHIGVTRDTCGNVTCRIAVTRRTPTGPATHAHNLDGQVVFMRRQNAAAELEQRFAGPQRAHRRTPGAFLSRGAIDIELMGFRDDTKTPVGRMNFGGAA